MDETSEAPHDSERSAREAKRCTRDGWILLALLLLALGIGVGIGAGLSTGLRSERAVAQPAADCAPQRAPADAASSVSAAPIRHEPAPCAVATPGAEPRASDGAPRAPSSARRRSPTTRPAPGRGSVSPANAPPDGGASAVATGPDLHAALQLLRAAQQSLKAADATGALSLLAQMARQTPEALVEEREVTRTLAYCAANDVDAARRTAEALRRSGVASVYDHRLSKSCAGPAPAPARLLNEMRRRALN